MLTFVLLLFLRDIDAIGEKVLPVIISINNGGMKKKVRKLARDLFIPIIRLEVNII